MPYCSHGEPWDRVNYRNQAKGFIAMSLQHFENQTRSTEKLAFTIPEACVALGIGKTSLYELIASGEVKSIRAAGRRLIRRSDLEAFLSSCTTE